MVYQAHSVFGTANSPTYMQGTGTLANGVTEKGGRAATCSKTRLQAPTQPSSKTSKWSQGTQALLDLCQLSKRWTLKRLRYEGLGMQADADMQNGLWGQKVYFKKPPYSLPVSH